MRTGPSLRNRRHLAVIGAVLATAVLGCTGYYYTRNLNTWSVGQAKQEFLTTYPERRCGVATCRGFEVRAAQRQTDGSLVEVGSLLLSADKGSTATEYWLLFRDGKLVQWGRPEDWQAVAARYQISFTPSVSAP